MKIGDLVFILNREQLSEKDVIEGWDYLFLIPTLDFSNVSSRALKKRLIPGKDCGCILQINGNRANIITPKGQGWTRLDYLELL
jgi:hypothetical protein